MTATQATYMSITDNACREAYIMYCKSDRGPFIYLYITPSGDAAYSLSHNLLTPYRHHTTVSQRRYNTAHIRT